MGNARTNNSGWKQFGTLMIDEQGNLRISQIPGEPKKGKAGKIVDPPTPRQDRIAKEKKEDYSLDGRIKKIKEKQK